MYSRESIPDGAAVGGEPDVGPAAPTRIASAGFGSPGTDSTVKRIDLNDALIRHPQGTFVMRASGSEMHDAGIDDGDVMLVDRVLTPAHGNIVVAVIEGEFLCRRLWKRDGVTRLQVAAADPDEAPRDARAPAEPIEIWGVVTTVIKSLLG